MLITNPKRWSVVVALGLGLVVLPGACAGGGSRAGGAGGAIGTADETRGDPDDIDARQKRIESKAAAREAERKAEREAAREASARAAQRWREGAEERLERESEKAEQAERAEKDVPPAQADR